MKFVASLLIALSLVVSCGKNEESKSPVGVAKARLLPDGPPGEKEKIAGLIKAINSGLGKTRDAHAKGHGCVSDVKVEVRKDLPKEFQVGFFSTPGKTYNAIVRLSPGDGNPKVSDHEGGPQGFALKILLDEASQSKIVPLFGQDKFYVDQKYYKTFDIVTISHLREFFVNSIDDYGAFFAAKGASAKAGAEAKAAGKSEKEIAEIKGKAFADSYLFPATGKKRPTEAKLIAKVANVHPKNIFLETYNSWVPSRFGDKIVKYEFAPCVKKDPATYVMPAEIKDWEKNPNFISEVVKYETRNGEQCFKLNVQVYKPGFPSIEDASAEWPEAASPYVEIATVTIPKKDKGMELLPDSFCEAASFHPGHASIEHFPVGGIQRARVGGDDYEGIYTATHKLRNENAKK